MDHDLVFDDVKKAHRPINGEPITVFRGLNLQVPAGEHLAIIGGSGVGKSTLLRLSNRLEDPDAGRILLGDKDISGREVTELRRQVTMVLQKPCLFAPTVEEDIWHADTFSGRQPDKERASRLLEMVGLEPDVASRTGSSLSVGQQQRVCLARALYLKPHILMLDETTSSLDPQLALLVLNNLMEMSKQTGMTILHVTHEMPKIKLADRVVLLDGGGVAESSGPESFLCNPGTEAGCHFLGVPHD